MFNNEIIEKIFSHPEAIKIPLGCQSTMISVIEQVLEECGIELIFKKSER